jgi:hypothetical protein
MYQLNLAVHQLIILMACGVRTRRSRSGPKGCVQMLKVRRDEGAKKNHNKNCLSQRLFEKYGR